VTSVATSRLRAWGIDPDPAMSSPAAYKACAAKKIGNSPEFRSANFLHVPCPDHEAIVIVRR